MPPVTRSQARNVRDTAGTGGGPINIVPPASSRRARTVRVYPVTSTRHRKTEANESAKTSVSAWPTLSTLSSLTDSVSSVEPDGLQTPESPASWAAGSVIAAPRKLQRSPDRIGGHGIDFWRNGSGVIVQDIVDGARVSQNSHNNGGDKEIDAVQQGGDSEEYIQQMISLMERREAALAAWTAAQLNVLNSMDTDVVENGSQQTRVGPHLGPEGTFLIDEHPSPYEGDTDIETDNNNELFALQHRHNLQTRALGLEPTILFGPGQYEPPKRLLPRWNLAGQGGEGVLNLLGLEPTELVL